MLRFFIIGLAACLLAAPARAEAPFVVGVLPYQGVRALVAEYNQLVSALRATLKRPVKLVTAKDVTLFGQRMLSGDYDLAIAPAHLARLVQVERGWQPLIRITPDNVMLLLDVRPEGAAPRPLKGATIATPGHTRFTTIALQRWLAEDMHLAETDYQLLDTGSHLAALQAMLDGRADFVVETLATLAQARTGSLDAVRIAHEIGTIPHLIYIVKPGLPEPDLTRLRRSLLAFPLRPPVRAVAADEHTLSAMDRYLAATRQLLVPSESLSHAQ